jgi:hypothetical protein
VTLSESDSERPKPISLNRFLERCGPFIFATILAACQFWHQRSTTPFSFPETTPAFLSGVVSVASICVGFVLTAASILVAVSNSWTMRRASESGAFAGVVRSARSSIYSGFIVAVASALALYFDPSWRLVWYTAAGPVWVFAAAYAFAAFVRFARLFLLLLQYIAQEEE